MEPAAAAPRRRPQTEFVVYPPQLHRNSRADLIKYSNYHITLNTNQWVRGDLKPDDEVFRRFAQVVTKVFDADHIDRYICSKREDPILPGHVIDKPDIDVWSRLLKTRVVFTTEVGANKQRLHGHVALTLAHFDKIGFSNKYADFRRVLNEVCREVGFYPINYIKFSMREGITAEQYAQKQVLERELMDEGLI